MVKGMDFNPGPVTGNASALTTQPQLQVNLQFPLILPSGTSTSDHLLSGSHGSVVSALASQSLVLGLIPGQKSVFPIPYSAIFGLCKLNITLYLHHEVKTKGYKFDINCCFT